MSRAVRNSIKLSFFTIISRVLGLVRDHFQAVFFGTGAIATAWEVAYMLPNMLRNLLAEGVMSQAFIPIYSEAMKESEQEAKRRASVVLGFLLIGLIFIVLIGILIFPYLLPVYTGKTRDEASLMILLARIMFIFIMTASLTAILSGIQNTRNEFTLPALSPILLNIVMITGFLVLNDQDAGSKENAVTLSMFVVAGGFLQFLLQTVFLKHRGWWPGFSFHFRDPVLKKVFSLMAPAVLGASLFQINQLTDIAIASYFIPEEVGAIPALRYAHRLIQLPTGIIGVALSTAILPALVEAMRQNRHDGNGTELVTALSFSLFLTVPAGIGLFFLGPDILNLLFYGGAWSVDSTHQTWGALMFFVAGVPFYSANKILTSSYYAYQDTRTPVRFLMIVVVINFLLNLTLVHWLQQGGIALSSSITAAINSNLLLFGIRNRIGTIPWKKLFLTLLSLSRLWISISVLLWLLSRYAWGWLDSYTILIPGFTGELAPRYEGLVRTVAGVGMTIIVYISMSILLRVEQVDVFLSILRRGKK